MVVDVSQSSIFGSGVYNKQERIVEIASVLALVAQHGKDHVGLLLFSDEIEEYVPPGSSLKHVHYIMERMLNIQAKRARTNISVALKHLLSLKKSDAIVFLLSDFIDEGMETYFAQASKRFDLVAVRCLDTHEKAMPAIGFIMVEDLETGDVVELDVRNKKNNYLKNVLTARLENLKINYSKSIELICLKFLLKIMII